MRAVWLGLILAVVVPPVRGQAGGAQGQVFQVDFSHPELSPSHWTMTLQLDGSGHFRSERGRVSAADSQQIDAPAVDRDIQVSAEYAAHVFHTAQRKKLSSSECESHMKVAFQGLKKLTLSGLDGEWVCTFNYSKDKEIEELGESLVAVAGAILEGAKLEMLLRHDRLALDSELEYLVEASKDGRVQQLGAIREILERLAEDPEVMERVRKRARFLLAKAGINDQGLGTGE
jgi:hypothetical protein